MFHICNLTSTSSQRSTGPSVWPQTKEMWVSIHFHVPLCLFCEIRLAFTRCYFSPVWFSLRPVWPEMNWPLLHVIDIVWLSRVTAARHLASSRPIKRPEEFKLFFFSPSTFYCKTWESATGILMSPRCQHLKRPQGVTEWQKGTVWIYAACWRDSDWNNVRLKDWFTFFHR